MGNPLMGRVGPSLSFAAQRGAIRQRLGVDVDLLQLSRDYGVSPYMPFEYPDELDLLMRIPHFFGDDEGYAAGYFTYMVSLAISAALYGWVSEGEDAEERRARRKRVAQIHFTAGGGKSIFDIYEEITGGQVLSAEEMTNALMKHGFK
jgi:hypothetical protein